MRRLLDVLRRERVAPLVEVLAEQPVQPLQRLEIIRQALFKNTCTSSVFTLTFIILHTRSHIGNNMTNLYVFFLREDCEGGLDVLVEEEVERGLPELVDALGVQAGVDPDHDVRLLHTLPVDVPAKVRSL